MRACKRARHVGMCAPTPPRARAQVEQLQQMLGQDGDDDDDGGDADDDDGGMDDE